MKKFEYLSFFKRSADVEQVYCLENYDEFEVVCEKAGLSTKVIDYMMAGYNNTLEINSNIPYKILGELGYELKTVYPLMTDVKYFPSSEAQYHFYDYIFVFQRETDQEQV